MKETLHNEAIYFRSPWEMTVDNLRMTSEDDNDSIRQ